MTVFFQNMRKDERNVLLAILVFDRPRYVNLTGITGYNDIRIRGPLQTVQRRGLVREVGGRFELVDAAQVLNWFRQNYLEELPNSLR